MDTAPWTSLVAAAALAVAGCDGRTGDDDAADDDAADDDAVDDDDTAPPALDPELTGVRRLLFEEFTNTGCTPCADANPVYDAFLEAVGAGNVVGLKVHTDWPSDVDPFYLADPDGAEERWAYYGVDGVPTVVLDGVHELSWHGGDYDSDIRGLFAAPLLVDVGIEAVAQGNGHLVAVRVAGTEELGGSRDVTLRVAAIQRHLELDEAPGSNGETEFHDAVIALLPDGAGTPLTVAPGSDEIRTFEYTLPQGWDPDALEFVAFVQDDASHEVWQAASTEAPPPHSARFVETEPEGLAVEPEQAVELTAWIQNSSGFFDSFDLVLEGESAPSTTVSWRVDGAEVTGGAFTADLDVGARAEITVVVDPGGTPGWAAPVLVSTPHCEDEPRLELDLSVVTYGADVLLVDADGGDDYDGAYRSSIEAAGSSHVVWRAERDLDTVDLARFPVVVWDAGWYFPHFQPEEQAALTDYLDGGGRLFISGMDIGWDQCDAASTYSDDPEWYQQTLHAEYMADDTDLTAVAGVAGDAVGDGLDFDIAGGDGADNQEYPSWVEPLGEDAEVMLRYSDGSGAAVRALHGLDGRVVYLAFGFEAVADAASRDALMARALAWLGS